MANWLTVFRETMAVRCGSWTTANKATVLQAVKIISMVGGEDGILEHVL